MFIVFQFMHPQVLLTEFAESIDGEGVISIWLVAPYLIPRAGPVPNLERQTFVKL